MTTLFASQALLPAGWASDVRVETRGGRVTAVEAGATPLPGDERHAVLLPGMPNLHSHAFQRGMAGLAEMRGPDTDNFWSWRETMYRFALAMTPQDVEAVAAQLYVEMLEAGFTRVGEFHYLHHDHDGRPYGDIAEMAARIATAADITGMALTLLPVFYAHSNFGGRAPTDGQRRFLNDPDRYALLLEACREVVRPLPDAAVGVAPHSLRAVTPDELRRVIAMTRLGPIHMHIAEQVKEVEDCLWLHGMRPVEWLLSRFEVDESWCLIHATHMTEAETRDLAKTGAVAGLCPVTEANLGDGIFPAAPYLEQGGRFGIGTDSNVLVGVADELRQFEYAQRLGNRLRNVVARPGGSTGRRLFETAVAGGMRALGGSRHGIEQGARADIVSLDMSHPSLAAKRGDGLLDTSIFAAHRAVDCVWVHGTKVVEGGRHHRRERIGQRYRKTMARLAG